jgi:hypothetical protein
MWRRARDAAGAELIAGCEAFITGRYADYLEDREQAVPRWVWLNLLAHGTAEQLASAQEDLGPDRCWCGFDAAWRAARAYLAGEVLDAVDAGQGPLGALQQRVLVPLESRFAAENARARRPAWLVTAVLDALEQDRGLRRHSNHADAPQRRPLPT